MDALTAGQYFDVHNFVKKAKELGVNEQFAEYEARQIEQAIETMSEQTNKAIEKATMAIKVDIKDKDLATKGDIRESELRIKVELIKWILGTGVTSVIVLCGAIFTMLKLMLHI